MSTDNSQKPSGNGRRFHGSPPDRNLIGEALNAAGSETGQAALRRSGAVLITFGNASKKQRTRSLDEILEEMNARSAAAKPEPPNQK